MCRQNHSCRLVCCCYRTELSFFVFAPKWFWTREPTQNVCFWHKQNSEPQSSIPPCSWPCIMLCGVRRFQEELVRLSQKVQTGEQENVGGWAFLRAAGRRVNLSRCRFHGWPWVAWPWKTNPTSCQLSIIFFVLERESIFFIFFNYWYAALLERHGFWNVLESTLFFDVVFFLPAAFTKLSGDRTFADSSRDIGRAGSKVVFGAAPWFEGSSGWREVAISRWQWGVGQLPSCSACFNHF